MRIAVRLIAAVLTAGVSVGGVISTTDQQLSSTVQLFANIQQSVYKWHWYGAEAYLSPRDSQLLINGGSIAMTAIPIFGWVPKVAAAAVQLAGISADKSDQCVHVTALYIDPTHPKVNLYPCDRNTGVVTKPG